MSFLTYDEIEPKPRVSGLQPATNKLKDITLATRMTETSSSISIQPIAEFNPDTEIGASLATRWTTWLDDFEMFLLASGIQDTKRQRALLLYQAGSRVREIFRQLNDTGEDATITSVLKRSLQSTLSLRKTAVMRFINSVKLNKKQPKLSINSTHACAS